jgi:hypothetical protein
MRIFLNILGFALIAIGLIWILQGVNILPGSFMTGQIQWAYRGAIAAAIGIAILVYGRTRQKR